MSKRALLWSLGGVAFAFTYIAAVNVTQVGSRVVGPFIGVPARTEYFTTCEGMWNPLVWFDGCSASLPPRLGVMALGTAVLLVCGYFAERGRPRLAELVRGHTVRFNPGAALWICHEENCSFTASTRFVARKHAVETDTRPAGAGEPGTAHGSTRDMRSVAPGATSAKSVPQHSTPTSNMTPTSPLKAVGVAENKACPDCAEEVRAAARKCRFCGYEFVNAAASGLGA